MALHRERDNEKYIWLREIERTRTLYITNESQLQPQTPLLNEIIDLNSSLEILAGVFPDVQIEVFREMLYSFSEESRLAVVCLPHC